MTARPRLLVIIVSAAFMFAIVATAYFFRGRFGVVPYVSRVLPAAASTSSTDDGNRVLYS